MILHEISQVFRVYDCQKYWPAPLLSLVCQGQTLRAGRIPQDIASAGPRVPAAGLAHKSGVAQGSHVCGDHDLFHKTLLCALHHRRHKSSFVASLLVLTGRTHTRRDWPIVILRLTWQALVASCSYGYKCWLPHCCSIVMGREAEFVV